MTAIAAVFVGGLAVSIVTTIAAPALFARVAADPTTLYAVYFGLGAVATFFAAGVVRSIFGFDPHPSYARVLTALLVGQAAHATVIVAAATATPLDLTSGLSPLGWAGFVLSVVILMRAPAPGRSRPAPEWEYKIPPGGPVWDSDWDDRGRRRST